MIDSSKIKTALKNCLGEFARWSEGNEIILIPKIGSHAIISGIVSLDNYNEYLYDTNHYNICGDDSFPELKKDDSAIVVTWLDNDNMVHFNAYIPYLDMRLYPLSSYVKSANNSRELDGHLSLQIASNWKEGEFTQCFQVREINYYEETLEYLFFEIEDFDKICIEHYLPTEEYQATMYDEFCSMRGCTVWK